jgi:TPP-dependent pyruvate/acetoin dehydrogenase alpha subunit
MSRVSGEKQQVSLVAEMNGAGYESEVILSIGAAIAESPSQAQRGAPSRAEREALLRALLLARGLERALTVAGHRLGRRGPLHQLTAAVSTASALDPDDRLFLPHDLISAHAARGMPPADLLAARLGQARTENASGPVMAGIAPGAVVPIATGSAMALAGGGNSRVAAAVVEAEWLADAATARALELARERALPVVVLGIGSANSAVRRIRGAADRDQPEAVLAAVAAAADTVRAEGGPAILYCAPLAEHADDPESARLAGAGRDPLPTYEHWLCSHGFAREELRALRTAVVAQVKTASEALAAGLEGRNP